MKTNSPKTWFVSLIVAVSAAVFLTVTGWLLASPTDEIIKALAASGAKSVAAAKPDAFVNAFTAVLVQTDENETASYVAAAEKLRPDLKDRIKAVAVAVDSAPIDENSDSHDVSPHRHHVKVCCHGHTLTFLQHRARLFLESHPECHEGPCNVFSTPPPQPTT
jgi:hypothetical protein